MIQTINTSLVENSACNPHLIWELLKYDMRKYNIKFSKNKSRKSKIEKTKHENIMKSFETTPQNKEILQDEYERSKSWLENWHEEYTKGVILRSKSDWYEQGEKSTKYFLNLEKNNSVKNTIRKMVINNNGSNDVLCEDEKGILDHAKTFYEKLFERKSNKKFADCTSFLEKITTPCLSIASKQSCEKELSLQELSDSLDSMSSGKSPGNDGLTIEFYKFVWSHIKQPLFDSAVY